MADLIVTAPAVQLKTEGGAYVHLYEGAPVPKEADAEQLKNLRAAKMVGEAPKPSAPKQESGVPAKSASKGDWETYARSKGATDADLDGKSKDDLIAAYGEQA